MRALSFLLFLPAVVGAAGFDAATASNQTGIEVFRQVGGAKADGNTVVSPYSITSALILAYAGADGQTRDEMSRALHLPMDEAAVSASFRGLRAALDEMGVPADPNRPRRPGATRKRIEWSVANRLFGQRGYAFRDEFLTLMRDTYDAPFEVMDFKQGPGRARSAINTWVLERTRGKIVDLIPPRGVGESTRLILANALYLKAPWASPFEPRDTRKRPFHFADRSTHDVAMMHQLVYCGYAKQENATILTLPYAGDDLQFVVILPDEGIDPASIVTDMEASDFADLAKVGRQKREDIDLWMPKFVANAATIELGTALRAMGIGSAFDSPPGSANFDRIAPRKPDDHLALSEVFHRTYVAVDEEGTIAAASTAVGMLTLGIVAAPPKPIEVHIDRPFLFAIQHVASGTCIFFGRINDPR
jgi:serpin B